VREAYDRYVRHTMPFLTATGGSLEFFGIGGHCFVGPPDERWDLVMLITQSSLDAFFAFASDEAYMAGVGHRTARDYSPFSGRRRPCSRDLGTRAIGSSRRHGFSENGG
jgi:hypothetical protein